MRFSFNPQLIHREPQYTPGAFSFDDAGKGWVYVRAQNFVHVHRACRFDTPSFDVERISTANDRKGDRVCITETEFATGDWGWMQVYGHGILDVQGQTDAYQTMRTAGNAQAGRMRDGSTGGIVRGVTLVAARSNTGHARAVFNFPYVP